MKDATRIACPLRATARRAPNAPAIVGVDGTLTYRELDGRVSAAATRMGDLGLRAGDRVALYLPKDEAFVLLLALMRAGCVACLLSTRLPPPAAASLPDSISCRALFSRDELPGATGIERFRPEDLLSGGLEARERSRLAEEVWLARDLPSTVVFTSGSTSVPKAALHTFGNHFFSAEGSNANIALAPGDRWLHSLPLYHVGGLSILFRCLLTGATVALPKPDAPLGEAIAHSGATHVSLVSTQLLRLLRGQVFDAGKLKAILLGGGPMPASLVDEAAGHGLPVHTSYGLTEMASQVTTTPPDASREALRTSGRPLPHREVQVSGEGEILVRGQTLFAGYVEGDAVQRPLDANGFFRTGDLGSLDADGYLRVHGRKDNLFVSGGENVQPEEIEDVLTGIEGVEEAVAVPVQDPEFGERPVAFVRMAGGVVDGERLAGTLEKILPRFKIPVAFYAWPDEAGGMKVDRQSFRERANRLRREERA